MAMRWDVLESALWSAFDRTRYAVRGGRVLVPEAPVDVGKLILRAAGGRAEGREEILGMLEEYGIERDWYEEKGQDGIVELLENPNHVCWVLEERYGFEGVVGFEWDTIGPMSAGMSLASLDVGDGRAYVCVALGGDSGMGSVEAIAAVEPADSREAWSAFIRSLLAENGTTYGMTDGLFAALPDMLWNYRPELIAGEAVAEGARSWMEWAEDREGEGVWTELLTRVAVPDPRARALGLLGEAAEALREAKMREHTGDVEYLTRWLEEREEEAEEEGKALSEEQRAEIVREWFKLAYRERGQVV